MNTTEIAFIFVLFSSSVSSVGIEKFIHFVLKLAYRKEGNQFSGNIAQKNRRLSISLTFWI